MQRVFVWLKTKQGIGVVFALLLTVFLIHLLLSPWPWVTLFDGFYLGFLTVLSIVLGICFSLAIIFDKHRKEIPSDLRFFGLKPFLIILLLIGWSYFYFVQMRAIGFLVVTPIFLLVPIYALGMRPWWKAVQWGIVMTGIVYTFFTVLGLRLPAGILAGILPF